MKSIIKNVFKQVGYELRKLPKGTPGVDHRPVGSMSILLEDLKSRGLNCNSILDVGANSASWSRMAKKVFGDAVFYLIEPQTEMKPHLEKFCSEFPGSVYFLAGAGAKKEVLTLTVWDDLAGSSFLPAANESLKSKGKQRDIEILAIDDLIHASAIQIPELIKLDIQGFELEALKGAAKTFGKTEVYILEVSLFAFGSMQNTPLFAEVINFMLDRNYVVYDFPGFGRRPYDGALAQCDICFVKKDGFLRASNRWE